MLLTDLVAEIQPLVSHRADITNSCSCIFLRAFQKLCFSQTFEDHLLRNVENLVSVLTQSLDYFLRLCKIWLHCHSSHHSLETEHWPPILHTADFSSVWNSWPVGRNALYASIDVLILKLILLEYNWWWQSREVISCLILAVKLGACFSQIRVGVGLVK